MNRFAATKIAVATGKTMRAKSAGLDAQVRDSDLAQHPVSILGDAQTLCADHNPAQLALDLLLRLEQLLMLSASASPIQLAPKGFEEPLEGRRPPVAVLQEAYRLGEVTVVVVVALAVQGAHLVGRSG